VNVRARSGWVIGWSSSASRAETRWIVVRSSGARGRAALDQAAELGGIEIAQAHE
jgi:hypothetical protein